MAKFHRIYCESLVAVEIFFREFFTTFTYFASKRRRYLLIPLRLKVCCGLFDHYCCRIAGRCNECHIRSCATHCMVAKHSY